MTGPRHSRRLVTLLALSSLALLGPRLARADDDFDSDRPDAAVSAGTITPGHVQLEAGWSASSQFHGPSSDTFGEGVIRIGATAWSELRLLPPSRLASRGEDAWSSAGAGFKWRFTPKDAKVPLGVVVDATFPGGDGAARQRTTDASFTLAGGTDVPGGGLEANLALVRQGDPDARAWVVAGALSWGQNWGARFGTFLEWFRQPADGADAGEFLDTGATWRVARATALDVHGGLRIAGAGDDRAFGAGLTTRW